MKVSNRALTALVLLASVSTVTSTYEHISQAFNHARGLKKKKKSKSSISCPECPTPECPAPECPKCPSKAQKPIFQDYNSVVYAQSNTLDGSPVKTNFFAFDEENDGILNLFSGPPLFTDTLKISALPGSEDRLRVKFSVFTFGGVPFDIPSGLIAIEDQSLFVPEVLLFDIGNVFGAPGTGSFGPNNDGIDIGQPWKHADDPNNAQLTWYFADGSSNSGIVPNILNLNDEDPNSLELQYFMLIDESQFAKGDAIGFTLTEDIILL